MYDKNVNRTCFSNAEITVLAGITAIVSWNKTELKYLNETIICPTTVPHSLALASLEGELLASIWKYKESYRFNIKVAIILY